MIPILLACANALSSPFHSPHGDKRKPVDEKAAASDDRENLSSANGNALAALAIAILFLLTLTWVVLVAHGVWGVVSWTLQ